MSLLDTLSTKQLEDELKRRKEEARPNMIPFAMTNSHFITLKEKAQEYIDYLATGDEDLRQNDIEELMFEEIMMLFFGSNVFEWVNKRTEEIG